MKSRLFSLYQYLYKNPLRWIVLLGFVLRLVYILNVKQIFYADEVFQVLEQGYRFTNGYGLIPWEYQDGLRNWLLPGVVGSILTGLKFVGVTNPSIYIPVVQTVFILLSLSLIISEYVIVKILTHSEKIALLTAFVFAVWYEFIYFASRPFFEVVAGYMVMGGVAMAFYFLKTVRDPGSGLLTRLSGMTITGILLGIAGGMRPQYLPVVSVVLIWVVFDLLKSQRHKGIFSFYNKDKKIARKIDRSLQFRTDSRMIIILMSGLLIGLGLIGLIDWISWGSFGYTWQSYLWGNLSRGSELITEQNPLSKQPLLYYLYVLLINSGGLLLVSLTMPKKYWKLWVLIAAVIVPHSLLSHKEYRFVFLAWPMVWMAAVMGGMRLLEMWKERFQGVPYKKIAILVIVFSVLGLLRKFPWQDQIYRGSLTKDGNLLLAYKWIVQDEKTCGLMDTTVPWMLTYGYYYVGKNIPLYSQNYMPNSAEYVNTYISAENIDVKGFDLVARFDDVFVYQRGGECVSDPDYVYEREVL